MITPRIEKRKRRCEQMSCLYIKKRKEFLYVKKMYGKILCVENKAKRSWIKEDVFGSNTFCPGWVKEKVPWVALDVCE